MKKFNIKKDGEYQPRLSTTKFSAFSEPDQNEKIAFEKIQIADHSLNGTILGFTNINVYYSCQKHWNKIDDEGLCPACNESPTETNFDFKAELILQIGDEDDEMKSFLLFKRTAKMIKDESTEDDIENKLAEFAGCRCKVEYDEPDDEEKLVIIKRFTIID